MKDNWFDYASVGHISFGIATSLLSPEVISFEWNFITSLLFHTFAEWIKVSKHGIAFWRGVGVDENYDGTGWKNISGDTLCFLFGFLIGIYISPIISSMIIVKYRKTLKIAISLTMAIYSFNEFIKDGFKLDHQWQFVRLLIPIFMVCILVYLARTKSLH